MTSPPCNGEILGPFLSIYVFIKGFYGESGQGVLLPKKKLQLELSPSQMQTLKKRWEKNVEAPTLRSGGIHSRRASLRPSLKPVGIFLGITAAPGAPAQP